MTKLRGRPRNDGTGLTPIQLTAWRETVKPGMMVGWYRHPNAAYLVLQTNVKFTIHLPYGYTDLAGHWPITRRDGVLLQRKTGKTFIVCRGYLNPVHEGVEQWKTFI